MLTSLITVVIAFILGTCAFLFRHTLKAVLIDPSSNPKLYFENKKTTLPISMCDTSCLENNLESRVKTDMAKEYDTYKPTPMDPYLNPFLTILDISFNANMLNQCKELYLESKEEYLRRELNSDIIKRKWQQVDLFIVNCGNIATKSMLVRITLTRNCLFRSSKITENSAKCYQPPTGAEVFNRNIIATADYYLNEFEYKYLNVADESSIRDSITYEINNPIRQGYANRYKLDSFYIDSTIETEFDINWSIYEDTLGKNGNHGVLKIKTIPNRAIEIRGGASERGV